VPVWSRRPRPLERYVKSIGLCERRAGNLRERYLAR
jgi:hypothetical protein